ncbi:MAG: TIGR02302 family protein [Rhodospirillaceae bacterium]
MELNSAEKIKSKVDSAVSRAKFAIFWETFWPEFWPVLAVLSLFTCAAFFNVLPLLPFWAHISILALFLASLVIVSLRLVRSLQHPTRKAAERRVEIASDLKHRPLTSLEDTFTGSGNAQTDQLWRLHRIRVASSIKDLKVGYPISSLAKRDPFALRIGLILLIIISFFWSTDPPLLRLKTALTPVSFTPQGVKNVELDIWVSPPEYTDLPPIFPLRQLSLKHSKGALSSAPNGEQLVGQPLSLDPPLKIPVGSKLTAQARSSGEAPYLIISNFSKEKNDEALSPKKKQFEQIDETNSQLVHAINESGSIRIEAKGQTLAKWRLNVIPDQAPIINLIGEPTATPQATTRIAFTISDDYGVKKAWLNIKRIYEKGTVVGKESIERELTLPRKLLRNSKEVNFLDLSSHKWAGTPIVMVLSAVDSLGQVGTTKPIKFQLPERQFLHPVAQAIIALRKKLFDDSPNREFIIPSLRYLAGQPKAFGDDTVVYLGLMSAASRLFHERGESAFEPVANLLWDTALRLEDGRLSIAEREMRRLQQALNKALSEGASQKELDRLMQQLRMAIQRYMQALAEQMRKNPQSVKEIEFDPNTMRLMSQSDIQRMMQQIQQLMQTGNREGARQMLARLQQMLSNMRSMQVIRSRGGRLGRRAGPMRQLQQLIQRQQQLMDRTFQFGRPGGNPQGQMPSPADQQALRNILKSLRGMMQGQMGGQAGKILDQAAQSMEDAIRALRGNQPNDAVNAQGRALQSLRQAGQSLMQEMRDRFSRQTGDRKTPGSKGRPLQDPLGRQIEEGDGFDESTVKIDAPSALKRTREILEELRRRSGEKFRPKIELDYIDRLLDRF